MWYSLLTTASIAHLQWMSSDSLYLSRFSGTSPRRSGSNPKSLKSNNYTIRILWTSHKIGPNTLLNNSETRDEIQKCCNYVPWGRAVEVGWAGLARHPIGGHGQPRGGIGAQGDGCGEFRFGRGEDGGADGGGGGDAAAHEGVGCHSMEEEEEEEWEWDGNEENVGAEGEVYGKAGGYWQIQMLIVIGYE